MKRRDRTRSRAPYSGVPKSKMQRSLVPKTLVQNFRSTPPTPWRRTSSPISSRSDAFSGRFARTKSQVVEKGAPTATRFTDYAPNFLFSLIFTYFARLAPERARAILSSCECKCSEGKLQESAYSRRSVVFRFILFSFVVVNAILSRSDI